MVRARTARGDPSLLLEDEFVVFSRELRDVDGDGAPELCALIEHTHDAPHDIPPHLWIVQQGRLLLDLWLPDANGFATTPHAPLQFSAGKAPLGVFIPSSLGVSGFTQMPHAFIWSTTKFKAVPFKQIDKHLASAGKLQLSKDGGLNVRTNRDVSVYDKVSDDPTKPYVRQVFRYQNGTLVGDKATLGRTHP